MRVEFFSLVVGASVIMTSESETLIALVSFEYIDVVACMPVILRTDMAVVITGVGTLNSLARTLYARGVLQI